MAMVVTHVRRVPEQLKISIEGRCGAVALHLFMGGKLLVEGTEADLRFLAQAILLALGAPAQEQASATGDRSTSGSG
jgi:hypothetical protein